MKDLDVEGAALREGDVEDAVCGVVPARVARFEDTQALGRLLGAAREAGLTVTPRGGGTALGWGAPPCSVDLLVDTRALLDRAQRRRPGGGGGRGHPDGRTPTGLGRGRTAPVP